MMSAVAIEQLMFGLYCQERMGVFETKNGQVFIGGKFAYESKELKEVIHMMYNPGLTTYNTNPTKGE